MKALLFASLFIISLVQGYIEVSVMMPLNTVNNDGTLNNPSQIQQNFYQLKSGNVDGVMIDVWWGVVEKSPKNYNWAPYLQLVQMAKNAGLKVHPVMSFHQCGTNVGDACYIPLPQWVLNIGSSNPDIFYRDREGGVDQEYLSLGVDNVALFNGRTGVEIYGDYMQSFYSAFSSYMPSIIEEIEIGLGPAGEMRYPSYQLQNNKWQYCGIGEFQCYDKYMLQSLAAAANNSGNPQWGHGGPDDAGTYNSVPSQTGFFTDGTSDNYAAPYGQFFLNWYFNSLLAHGDAILSQASQIFGLKGVSVAAKVSGIHWWYQSDSHAAEATAGYLNTDNVNAYLDIAQMFAKYNAGFVFTCLEMTDSQNNCGSSPVELVQQTILAAKQAQIKYAGENALPVCNPNCYQGGFDQIVSHATEFGDINRFTFLRLDQNLLLGGNWQMFTAFVNRMHSV